MEVSLRSRLGGRRAISWQAVVVGDLLIVTLASVLAATSPGDRSSLQAASDAFAITAATAIMAAAYTGLAHLTFLRNRRQAPVPVAVAVGFHLSIGVLFLIGFAVGAAILGVPRLGGSIVFSLGVLIGGLFVCLPTTLLLDHSDRYRQQRLELMKKLADLERLRISEWSLRRALRELVSQVKDADRVEDVIERLDALELGSDSLLATRQLWSVSVNHHQRASISGAGALSTSKRVPTAEDFTRLLTNQFANDYPIVRWSSMLPSILRTTPRFPLLTSGLSALLVLVLLTTLLPSVIAVVICVTTAIGIYVAYTRVPQAAFPVVLVWSVVSAGVWTPVLLPQSDTSVERVVTAVFICVVAVAVAVFLVSWVSSVLNAREAQLVSLEVTVDEGQTESQAALSSTAIVVSLLSQIPPLSDSPAVAACAAGLQRIRRGMDPVHACRILDWTESVVSAPVQTSAVSVHDKVEEIVHPWRALAAIHIESDEIQLDPTQVDQVVAAVDELVTGLCRQGEAETIEIHIRAEETGRVLIYSHGDEASARSPSPLVIDFTDPSESTRPIRR